MPVWTGFRLAVLRTLIVCCPAAGSLLLVFGIFLRARPDQTPGLSLYCLAELLEVVTDWTESRITVLFSLSDDVRRFCSVTSMLSFSVRWSVIF